MALSPLPSSPLSSSFYVDLSGRDGEADTEKGHAPGVVRTDMTASGVSTGATAPREGASTAEQVSAVPRVGPFHDSTNATATATTTAALAGTLGRGDGHGDAVAAPARKKRKAPAPKTVRDPILIL